MKPITDNVSVTGQLTAEDFKRLAAEGVKTLINNRPDGEIPMQPSAEDLAIAAKDHGLTYHHLPMQGGLTPDLLSGSVDAYANSPTPIVAFCGSGTRSAALWCFAEVKERGVDEVLAAVAAQGYQLEQLRGPLAGFAAA